jgi:DNA-binding NarL/FixJ family response regulator
MHNGRDPEPRPVRVALANDYEIVVAGLSAMLAPYADRVRVDDVFVGRIEPRREREIDVLLFDTYGRNELGFDALGGLVDDPSVHHVAVFTWEAREPLVDRALEAGVTGWLSKAMSAADLVDSLERVARGERVIVRNAARAPRTGGAWPGRTAALTERESEVLGLLAKGLRNADIAQAMFLSPETVKFHLRHLYRKLGVSSRGEAIAFAHSSEWYRVNHSGEARRLGS